MNDRPSASPWEDPAFVELYEADIAAEERGEIDEGLNRDEFVAKYAKYLAAS